MEQNKTGKYFKYAIGEVILVMVGILLALQVSNWNENRKDRQEEFKILTALKVDLIESKKRLNTTMKDQRMVIEKNILMLDILENKVDVNKHIDSIGDIFDYAFLVFFRVEPVTGAYDAMIGAGKTALIQNQDLSRLLAEYSTEVKMGFEDHEYGMVLMQLILEQTASYNGPFYAHRRNKTVDTKKIKEAISKLLNDDSVFGLLSKKNGVEWRRFQRQEDLLWYVEEILKLINQELND